MTRFSCDLVVLFVFSPSKVDVSIFGLKKGKYVQDWPVPVQDINDELVKCEICGGYLGLVAQVLTMYSFLLTFQSPSCLNFISEWDSAHHFFDHTKPHPASAQNHILALYVHCSHLMISNVLDCDHCIPCFSINRARSPPEITFRLPTFHVNVYLRRLDF